MSLKRASPVDLGLWMPGMPGKLSVPPSPLAAEEAYSLAALAALIFACKFLAACIRACFDSSSYFCFVSSAFLASSAAFARSTLAFSASAAYLYWVAYSVYILALRRSSSASAVFLDSSMTRFISSSISSSSLSYSLDEEAAATALAILLV